MSLTQRSCALCGRARDPEETGHPGVVYYCRRCVARCRAEVERRLDLGERIEETITRDILSWKASFRRAPFWCLVAACLLVGPLFALIERRKDPVAGLRGGWCLAAVFVAVWVPFKIRDIRDELEAAKRQLPRRTRVDGNDLVIEWQDRTVRKPISSYSWRDGSSRSDGDLELARRFRARIVNVDDERSVAVGCRVEIASRFRLALIGYEAVHLCTIGWPLFVAIGLLWFAISGMVTWMTVLFVDGCTGMVKAEDKGLMFIWGGAVGMFHVVFLIGVIIGRPQWTLRKCLFLSLGNTATCTIFNILRNMRWWAGVDVVLWLSVLVVNGGVMGGLLHAVSVWLFGKEARKE